MRKLSYFSMMMMCVMTQITSFGQADSVKEKPKFKLGVYYNSHLNYYGRTDSLRSTGVFPVAELWFNKHLYINAAPVFVNNAVQKFDYAGTLLTAGYRFDVKKWSGNFYVLKPLYENSSQLVQSALKAQVSGTLTSRNKIVNITGGGDIKFSDNIDYGVTAGLDHIFRFPLKDNFVLVVDPSVNMYAGTRQFTNTYYKKTGFLLFPGVEEEVSENVKDFRILSYEASMPVILVKGKFQFLAIPAWVMPQNLLNQEYGKEMLYVTIGAKVSF